MANAFNIKHVAPALAGPLVVLSRHTKILVSNIFQHQNFFSIYVFFMFVLYRKWCVEFFFENSPRPVEGLSKHSGFCPDIRAVF